MKDYPKFDTMQLLEDYNGINPVIKDIRNRFLEFFLTHNSKSLTNREYQQYIADIEISEDYPTFIISAPNVKSYVVAMTLNSQNKKIKKIKVFENPTYQKNIITAHNINDFELSDFENELLIKNFKFEGHFFKKGKWYNIGEKTGASLNKEFSLGNRIPDKIFVEAIIAETSEKYYCYGKNRFFWAYKEDIGNIYEMQWETEQIDIEYLNSLNLKGFDLYPFQERGIKFLLHEKYGFLLYDQGMGKTITSIASAIQAGAKKVLVVTLASLKVNWKREVEAMQQTAKIISSSIWNDEVVNFTIINYEILKNFHEFPPRGRKPKGWIQKSRLLNEQFDCIILDEGHKCKSQKSIRSKIVNVLAKADTTKYLWVLSGTLIEKNEDFFNVCKVINCGIKSLIVVGNSSAEWNNYNEYQLRYCNKIVIKVKGREIFVTPKIKGNKIENSNTYELRQRAKQKFYRVNKTKELSGFVKKHRTPLYFELTERENKKYSKLFGEYLEERKALGIQTSEDAARLTESIKLRQYLANIKVPHTIAFAKSLFEDGEKVIIFTHFKSEFEKIIAKLGKKVVYVKSGNAEKNQEAIDSFQNDPDILGIVGNISTLGTGHNLTKGDNVIMNSPNWNSGEHSQGEDRAWRLGRTEDVNVYYMLFEQTEEEIVFNRSESKKENKETFFDE